MFRGFSRGLGKKVKEADVPPRIHFELADRYSRNTHVDENGKRLPWPICYNCTTPLLEDGEANTDTKYYSGTCEQAGIIVSCVRGSTRVSEKRKKF